MRYEFENPCTTERLAECIASELERREYEMFSGIDTAIRGSLLADLISLSPQYLIQPNNSGYVVLKLEWVIEQEVDSTGTLTGKSRHKPNNPRPYLYVNPVGEPTLEERYHDFDVTAAESNLKPSFIFLMLRRIKDLMDYRTSLEEFDASLVFGLPGLE